jgi:hypothetical protein
VPTSTAGEPGTTRIRFVAIKRFCGIDELT